MLTQIDLSDELHKALKIYIAQNGLRNMPLGVIKILKEKLLMQGNNTKNIGEIQ